MWLDRVGGASNVDVGVIVGPLNNIVFGVVYSIGGCGLLCRVWLLVINMGRPLVGVSNITVCPAHPRLDHLLGDIQAATGVPVQSQVIFSSQCDTYLSVHHKVTEADFNIFMNRSGGSQVTSDHTH